MQTRQLSLKRSCKSFQRTTWTDLILSAFICFNSSKPDLKNLFCSWEYPNKQGIGCNILSTTNSDSANFLSFLQKLRGMVGTQKLTLSAAVSITTFIGSDGKPMTDVSGFAKVLDYIGSLFPAFNCVPV